MNNAKISSTDNVAPKELLGIQHLRGIAALLVVFTHIDAMSRFPKYFNINVFAGWFDAGAVGVQLFFVISGFIIPYVSLATDSLEPKTTASSFFRRRFIRIIPFMWACIIGYALLRLLGRGTFPLMPYLRAMTLFPVGEVSPLQIWTLRHEFLFYSIFCLTILLPKKQQWLVITFWFLTPFIWFPLSTSTDSLTPESFLQALGNFVFNKHNIFFGIGFLIGILHIKNYINWKWVTRHGFFFSLVSVIPLLIGALLVGTDTNFSEFWAVITLSVLAAISLLAGISLDSSRPLTLIDKVGLKLGDASYSIYLTHAAFISAILGIWSKLQPDANYALIIIVGTALACVAGVAVHILVEKPLIKFVQKILKPKVAQPLPSNG